MHIGKNFNGVLDMKISRKSTDDSLKFDNKNWKFSNKGNPNIYLLQKKGIYFNFLVMAV